MEASLKMWVSAWDSKGYKPEMLDKGELINAMARGENCAMHWV